MNERVCEVEGCVSLGRKYDRICAMHRKRMKVHGSYEPRTPLMLSPEERVWLQVDKTPTCWLWTGATPGGRYGVVHVNGRRLVVHRFIYESPWIVTSRRKVHERRTCASARRVAFPLSWLPSVQRPGDHACATCLGGLLPTQDEIDEPLTVGCSQCGAAPHEECRGDGQGYHLSRYDQLDDA